MVRARVGRFRVRAPPPRAAAPGQAGPLGVIPMLEDQAGKTIDVGRKSRSVPAALRRALEHRDGGCRFPGCSNTRWVDAHHVDHWLHGGETSLANTVLLCRRHHRFVHEYGYSMALVDGQATFRDPRGRVIPPCPPRPPLTRAGLERLRAERPTLTSRTNAPGWDGLPVHYELCVDALARPAPWGRGQPSEHSMA
jgi:hypothetical protein